MAELKLSEREAAVLKALQDLNVGLCVIAEAVSLVDGNSSPAVKDRCMKQTARGLELARQGSSALVTEYTALVRAGAVAR